MRARSFPLDYLEALLIAVIFATFARTYVVQAFKIPTGSMEENLLIGDHLLVNKFIYGPTASGLERFVLPSREVRRGDVVVFKYPLDPSRDFIKRCVGLGGDRIEIVDKVLHVNSEPVAEDYVYHDDPHTYPNSVFLHEDLRFRDNFGPFTLPEDHLFFMGDNRDNSNDSRFWGPVPASYVKGRAFLVYWSFDADGLADDASAAEGWLGRAGRRLAGLASRTRWPRSFLLVR